MAESVDLHIGGYHLTESIGTGGMGSVFRAVVEEEGKCRPVGSVVAVKLLHPHLRTVGEFVKRFHREAKLAAKIDHPNVIRVLDEGVHEGRHHYIVMELAEGLKLSDLMADGIPLSPQQTLEVMNQVCDALTAAANVEDPDEPGRFRSLVHRDVKPDNIIIEPLDRSQYMTMTQTGDKTALANIRVKLLDFGLAKDVKALSTILSQTGQSLGTPAYMSPEQCRGDNVDTRSDLYGLGVVAYHMITGTTPFAGPTTVAYAQQHAEEIPPDILNRNPMCPKPLADCIYRCMAKDPADRYADPAELQSDLARVAAGQSIAKVHKFKKKGQLSKRKLAGIISASMTVAAILIIGAMILLTGSVKADLNATMQEADVAIARSDFVTAEQLLNDAIESVDRRPDGAELAAPLREKLTQIATQVADQQREIHQREAATVVGDLRAAIAAGKFTDAANQARTAMRKYGDTPSAEAFSNLLAQANERLAAQREADAARAAREAAKAAEEARVKHVAFCKYRDEGLTTMNAGDYLAAERSFTAALSEEENEQVRAWLTDCVDRTTIHRIAVADFEISGNVGISDAGKSVAQLLLARFSPDRYQLVERSHLAAILAEHDLAMSDVVSNPALLRGKKLSGVRYLVLGTVVKFANLAISARLVDVTTGDILQTAEVSAEDTRGLQVALGELAKLLQMTAEEKKAYLDEQLYPQLLSDARSKAVDKDYAAAIGLYRRVLAIRTTVAVQDELRSTEYAKAEFERLAAEERQRQIRLAEEQRQRQAKLASLLAEVRTALSAMPAKVPDELSASQEQSMNAALAMVDEALGLDGGNAEANQLKQRVETYLQGGKYLTLVCGGGVTMQLVRIPSGSFMMGSPESEQGRHDDEGPQRRVTISRPFHMGTTEVTQAQWQAVMGTNPSHFEGASNPVERVSWNDATEFCRKLSHRTGRSVRLPTEAEWEYACRAGTTTPFHTGQTISTDQANYDGDYTYGNGRKGKDRKKTIAVGSFQPNAWGLYDMHGNVLEWCGDWYQTSYRGLNIKDPNGPNNGSRRVVRGGCWYIHPRRCRSAYRIRLSPANRFNAFGFRVVVSLVAVD